VKNNIIMVWLDDPLGWAAVVTVSALLGAMAVDRDFYNRKIQKPRWAPPAWMFQVVWTLLYTAQALASYLLIDNTGEWVAGIWVYIAYLIISTAWNWIFFRFRMFALSKLVIIIAAGLSVAATVLYWEEGPFYCGLLMTFTTVWMVFAAALNWSLKEKRYQPVAQRDEEIALPERREPQEEKENNGDFNLSLNEQ